MWKNWMMNVYFYSVGKQKTENFWRCQITKKYKAYQENSWWVDYLRSSEAMDKKKTWPSLSLASVENIKQTWSEIHLADIKIPKKGQFLLHFYSNFLNSRTVYMALKNCFRPNLLDLEEKFWFCQFYDTILAPIVVHQKSTKMAEVAL